MPISEIACDGLLVSFARWVIANEQGDKQAAILAAQQVVYTGELIAIHPAFAKQFERWCPGVDSQQALAIVSRFMVCVAECALNETARTPVPSLTHPAAAAPTRALARAAGAGP